MTVYTRVDVVPQEGTGEISLVFFCVKNFSSAPRFFAG